MLKWRLTLKAVSIVGKKMTPEVKQYIDSLTFEDAKRAFESGEWTVEPADVIEYCRFDREMARYMRRAPSKAKVALVDALCAFLLRGEVPSEEQYDAMPDQAAAAAEHAIKAQEKELPGRYTTRFKQHKTGKLIGK